MIKNYIYKFGIIFILSLFFSAFNIVILAFINKFILSLEEANYTILVSFVGLLVLFFIATYFVRFAVARINNGVIYDLRVRFVLRVLNTKMIFDENKPKILASLSKDINNISNGFMRLSDAVQGFILVILSFFYFFYLSSEIAIFVTFWFICIGIIVFIFINKAKTHFISSRKFDDLLYKSYELLLAGFKELRINQNRQKSFLNSFLQEANLQKTANTKAEIYANLSSNFLNVMMLGGIGIVMFLSLGLNLTDFKTATTVCLSMMFLRAPFMMAVSSVPSILMANISLKKVKDLNLVKFESINPNKEIKPFKWNEICLKNISFSYFNKDVLNGLNLTIKKGETLFLIGENGSGKSTLFLILCGLLTPKSGEILIDDKKLNDENLSSFQNSLSVDFNDFYLFGEILTCDEKFINFWCEKLKLSDKVELNLEKNSFKFSSFNLSTGQKKRLALLEVLALQKDFLMLDEFAADQDPEFREYFYKEILPLLKSFGVSIFAISHDDRFFKFADKIYEMDGGKIIKLSKF